MEDGKLPIVKEGSLKRRERHRERRGEQPKQASPWRSDTNGTWVNNQRGVPAMIKHRGKAAFPSP